MMADPEWISFMEESAKLGALEHQENRLMTRCRSFLSSAERKRRARTACIRQPWRLLPTSGPSPLQRRIVVAYLHCAWIVSLPCTDRRRTLQETSS